MNTLGMAIFEVVAVYVLFCLIQAVWGRRGLLRRIGWWLNLAILSGALHSFLGDALAGWHPALPRVLRAAFLFFLTATGLGLADWALFESFAHRRRGRPIPVVVRDIGRWLLLMSACFLIIRHLFPTVNLNVLAVSSLVVGYVVANATQDTLGNLVAGLALNTERPFQIGDWVTIGGHTGRVVDMTWRATRLCTKNADYIVIPNSSISREPIANYSRPSPVHAQSFVIGASYETPPKQVREVLMKTLREVPAILTDPAPRVYLTGYGDFAIQYTVKYFVADYEPIQQIESDAMDLIWYAFRREGIGIPFPIRDVRLRTITPDEEARTEQARREEAARILRKTDLFQMLSEEDIGRLAEHLRPAIYARGECLVRQGERGDSFFLVRSGGVSVTVRSDSGRDEEVARLEVGGYFGEMSLLTGAPRAATVRAESDTSVWVLAHAAMAEAMRRHPRLAEAMAEVLERRNQGLADHRNASPAAGFEGPAGHSSGPLIARIRAFFKLPLVLVGLVLADAAQAEDWAFPGAIRWAEGLPDSCVEWVGGMTETEWRTYWGTIQSAIQAESLDDRAWVMPETELAFAYVAGLPGGVQYVKWLRARMERSDRIPLVPPPAWRRVPDFSRVIAVRVAVRPPEMPPSPVLSPEVAAHRTQVARNVDYWKKRVARVPIRSGTLELVARLKEVFLAEGIPPEWVWLAEVESSWDPMALSPSGALGLFQFMPETARRFGLRMDSGDERTEPEKSARAAAQYLRFLHGECGGDWLLTLAAYHGGEGRIVRLMQRHSARTFTHLAPYLPPQTQRYVLKVLATVSVREQIDPTTLPSPRIRVTQAARPAVSPAPRSASPAPIPGSS